MHKCMTSSIIHSENPALAGILEAKTVPIRLWSITGGCCARDGGLGGEGPSGGARVADEYVCFKFRWERAAGDVFGEPDACQRR